MEGTSQQSARQFKARESALRGGNMKMKKPPPSLHDGEEVTINIGDFQKLLVTQKTEAPLVPG